MKPGVKLMTKLGSAVMAAAIMFSIVPGITGNDKVNAAVKKDQSNTGLSATQIANPTKPANQDSAWSGSYVYFGNYNNKPIKFRVLDKASTKYGTKTMLLDSDECLLKRSINSSSVAWNSTSLKTYLNNTFYSGAFNLGEKNSLYSGSLSSGSAYAADSYFKYAYGSVSTFTSNKVFVLDASDLINENYGYSSNVGVTKGTGEWSAGYTTSKVGNRIKKYGTTDVEWWIRNKNSEQSAYFGCVATDGHMSGKKGSTSIGVAPATNVNLSQVALSTLVSGTSGQAGAEYKLTLTDSSININLQDNKTATYESGAKITVPYFVTGTNRESVNRVSVLILNNTYTEGNTNGAKILYYNEIGGSYKISGTGTFTLPSNLNINAWGSSYHVYIIAEDINGDKESDYCSKPYELEIPTFKNVWIENGSNWNYYNAYGMKLTGWQKIDGNYYYFNNQGNLLKDWRKIDGNWYFLGGNGIMRTEWQQIGSNWYYFGGNGILRTGWEQIGGYWYYFGDSGVMRIGWQQISGNWYYFDSKGHMLKSWQQMGDYWYYFGDDGVMRIGWAQVNGNWYYFNSSGHELKGWQQIGGYWYYFGDSGIMRRGWQMIGGSWYYFNRSGQMSKSWQQISGNWYYFGDNGVMRSGWQKLGSYWYYFESNGIMVTGSKSIGGKTYKFDSNGRCTNP